MTIPLDIYKASINAETLHTLDYLGTELSIPPMFSCLHMGGFCFSNVLAYYEAHGKEPPKELVDFMKSYPAVMDSLQEVIQQQFLLLNTQGTA